MINTEFKREHCVRVLQCRKPDTPLYVFSGFLDSRGNPNGYNSVWCPTGDAPRPVSDYYFLEVVKEIPEYKVGL